MATRTRAGKSNGALKKAGEDSVATDGDTNENIFLFIPNLIG